MAKLLEDLIHVFRHDRKPSENDLRLTLLPNLLALWIVLLSGGGLLMAFDQEFVQGYAFVHGYDEDTARTIIEQRYYRALIGLSCSGKLTSRNALSRSARGGAFVPPQPERKSQMNRMAVVAQVRPHHGDGPVWDMPIPAVVISAVGA